MNAVTQLKAQPELSKWVNPHPSFATEDGELIAPIDMLFANLGDIYPSRWKSNFQSTESIASWRITWAHALTEAGVGIPELKRGLRYVMKNYDWPPSLPEFIFACQPITNYEAAFSEAVAGLSQRRMGNKGNWSHPAIFWAASRMQTEIMSSSYPSIKSRWEEAIKEAMTQRLEEVPDVVIELPEPKANKATVEESIKSICIQKLKPVDPKRWAKRIMKKLENNEWVPLASQEMAKRALGLID